MRGDWNTPFMIDSGVSLPVQSCLEADDEADDAYDDLVRP